MIDVSSIWLDKGIHSEGAPGACLMEHVALMLGEQKSYKPEAISPVVASIAGNVNDRLDHGPRQELVQLIPELVALASLPTPRSADERLALWVLAEGLESLPRAAVQACRAALREVEAWYAERSRRLDATEAATRQYAAWAEEEGLPEGANALQVVCWRTWLESLLDFVDAVAGGTDLKPVVRPIVREFLLPDLVDWLREALEFYRQLVANPFMSLPVFAQLRTSQERQPRGRAEVAPLAASA
jgi:hypothetical protein